MVNNTSEENSKIGWCCSQKMCTLSDSDVTDFIGFGWGLFRSSDHGHRCLQKKYLTHCFLTFLNVRSLDSNFNNKNRTKLDPGNFKGF